MKKIIVLSIIAFSFPVASIAQHEFAFDDPIDLVKSTSSPNWPDIVWDGKRFAIVYDNYFPGYNELSTEAFLMFVDTDGNILMKPKKISKKKFARHAKIVWTGKEFGVLLTEGKKIDGKTNYNFYLVRIDPSGKVIAREQLPGFVININSGQNVHILWTGSDYAIFYKAKAEEHKNSIYLPYLKSFPRYYKTKGTGAGEGTLKIYDYDTLHKDVVWDGKRFVVLMSDLLDSWVAEATAEVILIDGDGNILNSKATIGFGIYNTLLGVTLIPNAKKDRYILLCAGADARFNLSAPPTVLPSTTNSAFYSGTVKLKQNKISNFKLKKITTSGGADWMYPDFVSVGKKRFVVGSHNDGITIAQVNDSGNIVGAPLKFTDPVNGCSLYPIPASSGNKIGIIWAWGELRLHVVDVK